MAQHRVTDPQGRVHLVEAPDGATPEEIVAYAMKMAAGESSGVPGIGLGDTPAPQDLLNKVGPGSSSAIGQGSIGAADSGGQQSGDGGMGGQPGFGAGEADAIQRARAAGIDPGLLKTRARGLVMRKLYPEEAKTLDTRDKHRSLAALNGPTFGAGEEILAGLQSLGGADYSNSLDTIRNDQKAYTDAHPGESLAYTLAGGAMLPMGLYGQFAKARPIVASGLTGLGYGAAYGFGEGEGGFKNRLASAGTGATLGGLFSGGLGLGGAALGGFVNYGPKAASAFVSRMFKSPESAAYRDIAKAAQKAAPIHFQPGPGQLGRPLNTAGQSGADVLAGLSYPKEAARVLGAPSVPPTMIADVDPAFSSLLRRVNTGGGPAASLAEATLKARQEGSRAILGGDFTTEALKAVDGIKAPFVSQYRRILEGVGSALGANKGESAYGFTNRKIAELKARSKPMYDAAHAAEQPFDLKAGMGEFFNQLNDLPKASQEKAKAVMKHFFGTNGAGEFNRIIGDRPGDLRKFQKAKELLDDEIQKAVQSGDGTFARAYQTLKSGMLDVVDQANPLYKKARSFYAGEKSVQDAVDLGKRAFRDGSEVASDVHPGLSHAEKYAYALGAHSAAKASLGSKVLTGDHTQFFRKPNVQETLSAILPKNRAKALNTLLDSQNNEIETYKKVLQGSQTANKAAELMDPGAIGTVVSSAAQTASGHFMAPVLHAVTSTLGHYFKIRKETAAEIAKLLMTTDPVKQARVAAEIDRRFGPGAAKQAQNIISKLTGAPPVSAAVGMASGQASAP